MKILIVTQYFHPEPFRINDLAVALHEKGHSVTVLTGMPNYPEGRIYPGYGWRLPARENFLGVSLIRVPLVPRGSSNNWRLILNYLSFVISSCTLGPLLCRGKFDIVFVFEPSPITVGLPGLLMGRINRIPVMLWIQDLWPETLAAVGRDGHFSKIATWVANFVHRRCDLLLAQSEAFMAPLMSRGIAPGRIRYLPNWAESFYKPGDSQTTARCASPEVTRILFAGNIGAAQSFETILEAARLLRHRPDIHWVVAGDGLMRRWVTEQVRLSGLESTVTLLGRRPPAEMPSLYSRADALLVTLRRDPVFAMTIPAKIQSYLASGKLIVGALDGEGARTIRASGAGLVVDAQDAQGLAQCVQEIAAMSMAERDEMGRRGREYFEQYFSRDKLVGQLESWMHELAGT